MGTDFDSGWNRVGASLTATVTTAQYQAARGGIDYLPQVLAETGQDASRLESISAAAFAGTNRWGAPVESILRTAVIRSKQAVAAGFAPSAALLQGRRFLDTAVPSLLADSDRSAVQAGLTSAGIAGYVRMLNAPSCHRCIILAGRWYRWNKGFQRHPLCDCRHIPAAENMAGDLTTDPYAAFNAMSEAEQDAAWGKSSARAIRDGADIYRVSNVKTRGLTSERSARNFGTPSKMTLDDIYAEAGTNRTKAIELMRSNGYIVGQQQIRQQAEQFAAPISRPVVAGSRRDRVLQARSTGERDPLDRATMTAAEQRLFDASYRLQYARRNGFVPRSIGPNSADVSANSRGLPLTPERLELLEASLQRQLAAIDTTRAEGAQLASLADALGLNDDRADVIHERIWRRMQQRYAATNGGRLALTEALRTL